MNPLEERASVLRNERERLLQCQAALHSVRSRPDGPRYVLPYWELAVLRQIDRVWEAQEALKCARRHFS